MGSAAATAAALMGWAAPPTPPFRLRTLTSLTQTQTDNGIREGAGEGERGDTFSLQLQGGQVAASNNLNFVFRVRSKE